MRLSFVILCCDKDVQYIPSLIKNIQDVWQYNLSFNDYEIIIIDNGTCLQEVDNAIVVHNATNLRQFTARQQALDFVTGDYVWYIDADDTILDIPIVYDGADMIYFNTLFTDIKYTKLKSGKVKKDDNVFLTDAGIVLWDRIISIKLLKKVRSIIGVDMYESIGPNEDIILSALLYYNTDNIHYNKQCCYMYNFETSSLDRDVVDWDVVTYNVYKSLYFIYTYIKVGKLPESFLSILKMYIAGALNTYAHAALKCTDKDKAVKWLIQHWSKKTIADILNHNYTHSYDTINLLALVSNAEDSNRHYLEELYETVNTDIMLRQRLASDVKTAK